MSLLENYFKVSLDKELEKFPNLRTEDIEEIRQWISTQPHLPQVPDILIAYFLHSRDYDVEEAKTTVGLHCEYKRAFTEFFSDWDPLEKNLSDQYTHVFRMGFLPKESCSQSMILMVQIKQDSVEMYNYASFTKWMLMSFVCNSMHEGMPEKFKVVMDVANYTFSHFRKVSMSCVNHYQQYTTNADTSREPEFHFLNSSFAIKTMFGICSVFMNKTNQEKLHFYGQPEEFFKSCCKEVVPEDYGGSGPSLQTIHDVNTERVICSRRELMEFCDLKAINTENTPHEIML